jgi:hypothetical protein
LSTPPIDRVLTSVAADALRAKRQATAASMPKLRHQPSQRDTGDPQERGIVLSSPHGAAVHLACALGVPWLPLTGIYSDAVAAHAGLVSPGHARWRRPSGCLLLKVLAAPDPHRDLPTKPL